MVPTGTERQPVRAEPDRRSYGVALEGRMGQAYNEEAFRYFLDIERKRAARLGRPFVLLLVGLKDRTGPLARIAPDVAGKLFSGLWQCLRETDVIGWFRDGRVAGAVLSQFPHAPSPDVPPLVRQRVRAAIGEGLRPDVASRLHVHVYQRRPAVMGRSSQP